MKYSSRYLSKFSAGFLSLVLLSILTAGCQSRTELAKVDRRPLDAGTVGGAGGSTAAGGGIGVSTPKTDAGPPPISCANPNDEVCNGLDDDCNGLVDDRSSALLQDDLNACGKCGVSCLSRPNANVKCQNGECRWSCRPDYRDLDNDIAAPSTSSNGCECGPPINEICDGKDNDCDGVKDNGFKLDADVNNCGACGKRCMDLPGATSACKNSVCAMGMCKPGFFDRDNNPANGCESTCPGANNGVEICDGQDNDCDGKVDELVSANDRTMDDKIVFIPDLSLTIFAYEASRPAALAPGMAPSGVPCSMAGKTPWASLTKEEAGNACKALGGMWRLCTADEWFNVCSKRGANKFPYGAKYEPKICNGADFDAQPKVIATGTAAMCAAKPSDNADDAIFDLSGNVREWTTGRTAGSFELRGGAYNVTSIDGEAPGLICGATIPAPGSDLRLPSVGFRCCHPGPLPQ